jgi:preprotein translocase subunit SecG
MPPQRDLGYTAARMTALTLVQSILAVALTVAILLQQRGAGVGGAFGGEITAYRSRRGIERTLFRLTIVLATLWVVFSVLALYLQTSPTA